MIANAAFGDDPGRWPLPTAHSAEELWLRAVVAGGQGRYANAYADLASVRRAHRGGRLASLAHSTQASFLRQLGWHDQARGWDQVLCLNRRQIAFGAPADVLDRQVLEATYGGAIVELPGDHVHGVLPPHHH